MKLISLNTWGGKIYQPLINFIRQHSKDTDIFCFQEIFNTTSNIKQYNGIRTNLLNELIKILPDFSFYYSVEVSGFDENAKHTNFNLTVGKAIFIRKSFQVNSENDLLLYGNRLEKCLKEDFSNLAVTMQCVNFTANNKPYIICNIHGISFPGSKLDTKLRLEHSRKIIDYLKDKKGTKILIGDFNLLPETKSIGFLEKEMRNLIKEYKIQLTRSKLTPYYGKENFQPFADYTFVSDWVEVESFEVPKVEISDHLPMILEFS